MADDAEVNDVPANPLLCPSDVLAVMADDAEVKDVPANPCCNVWKDKYSKLLQKCAKVEDARTALRKCIELYEQQIAMMETQNLNLKKVFEEERVQAENERKEKVKESAARVSLENEISALKSEILSLNKTRSLEDQGVDEVKLLKARVCDGEVEINRLREQLQKERSGADSERKKAEARKKRAGEAEKSAKAEKSKADEELTLLRARVCNGETEINRLREHLQKERARADSNEKSANEAWKTAKTEKCRAEGLQADMERVEKVKESVRLCLKDEISSLKSQILSLQQKRGSGAQNLDEITFLRVRVSERELEIKRLKELLDKERTRANSEKKKAEAERKKAHGSWESVRPEKSRADEERRVADIGREEAKEDGLRLERLKVDANEARSKLVSETLKSEEANKRFEAERHKVIKAKKQAEEKRKLAEMSKRNVLEEKFRDESKSEEANRRLGQVKRKAKREKKLGDLEMRKAAEHRMVAEAYKKAMEEKARADKLGQQLEEDRRRTDKLRKEIQELVSPRILVDPLVIPPKKDMIAETDKMKLLRKQLKLVKMQVKHAKQVAKLEKGRNDILKLELCRLKLEFSQFSHRLEQSDCFADCEVGKAHLAKNGNINLKRTLIGSESNLLHLQNGNELLKPSCGAMDASDCFKQSIECSAPLRPISGNCTESTSGIASKLELLRGSNGKKFHSSAIDSSMASFSDRPLVGSQERGAFSVTKSAEWAEEKSNAQLPISQLSGDVNRTRYDENIAVVAENNVRSPLRVDVGRRGGHSNKRKRNLDAIESIEHLYSEGKKWHLKVSENLSLLQYMLGNPMDKFSDEGRYLIPSLQDNLYTEQEHHHKKRKVFFEEKVAMRHLCSSNERKDELETNAIGEANLYLHASPPADNVTETTETCNDEVDESDRRSLESFEEVVNGDYMKLLDLDNTVDEERYRMAIEMPLSPTLPEIEFQSSQSLEIDDSKRSTVDCFCEGLTNVNDYLVPCCSSDVTNKEIDSNKLELFTSGIPYIPQLRNEKGILDSLEISVNDEKGESNTIQPGSDCVSQIVDPGSELGISDSGVKRSKILCESDFGSARDDLLQYCVVFSDINDSSSLSKIFCTSIIVKARCCSFSQTDCIVRNTLSALLEVENLLPKEKVCVFFSMLLHCFSGIALKNFKNLFDSNFIHFLDIIAGQMRKVMSDVETRSIFSELCDLDELLTLIEDFLIDGRVLVRTDVYSEPSLISDQGVNIVLDSGDIPLTFQNASPHQLVCGAIALASFCAAFDRIGFICEASYNVYRMKKVDSAVLTFLHIFAYICGSKYFTLSDYTLIMTVMNSLVTFRERDIMSTDSAISLQSVAVVWPDFPLCTKCPFSGGAVSMEVLISLLLEKLQNYALCDISHEDLTESVSLLNFEAPSQTKKTEPNSGHDGEPLCVLCRDGGVSCCLHKFGILTSQSKNVFDGTLGNLGDVLSLVELVASNMSWDWTCDNIVARLLKMLESRVLENSFAAILILLGQLVRLGIDANGYEDTAVENIRGRLCAFLSQSVSRKVGLHVQIATVSALLGMICLSFEELVKSNVELSEVVRLSIPADCIRKWYFLLSNEHKSLSFRLLTAGVPSCRNG